MRYFPDISNILTLHLLLGNLICMDFVKYDVISNKGLFFIINSFKRAICNY